MKKAGLLYITRATAAGILYGVYLHGNDEQITYNSNLRSDLEVIQDIYNIKGGKIPDAELSSIFRAMVRKNKEQSKAPEWVKTLFRSRYNINLID